MVNVATGIVRPAIIVWATSVAFTGVGSVFVGVDSTAVVGRLQDNETITTSEIRENHVVFFDIIINLSYDL